MSGNQPKYRNSTARLFSHTTYEGGLSLLVRPELSLGFLVADIGGEGLTYDLMVDGHSYYREGGSRDVVLFVENIARPPITPPFMVCGRSEAYSFQGALIATDYNSALALINLPCPVLKYFYVQSIEHRNNFETNERVYRTPSLPLLVRSQQDKEKMENLWNRSVRGVVEKPCIDGFVSIVRDDEVKIGKEKC